MSWSHIQKGLFCSPSNSLDCCVVVISNLESYITDSRIYSEKFSNLLNKINSPIPKFITDNEITVIDEFANEFSSTVFSKKCFKNKDFSDKLQQLWNLLKEIYNKNPSELPDSLTHILNKKAPKKLTDQEKIEFTKNLQSKFILKTKNVNSVTELIFNQVKHDYETNNQDVLSICGILISFVLNSESHLYFAMESIIEAKRRLGITNFEVEDIFSVESSVIQNTKDIITDIRAIRDAVSHGAFKITFESTSNEYIIDFQSILSDYRFNRKYTARELLNLYRHYDKLRDIQELFIRMAFLNNFKVLFY